MFRGLVLAATGASVLALAGCGGGGGSDPVDTFRTNARSASDMITRVLGDGTSANPGLTHTSPANLPTSGTATFTGYSALVVYDPASVQTGATLVGDATVTADFAASTVTGTAGHFTGALADSVTGAAVGPITQYDGTLSLSGGCIGATACGGAVTNPYEAAAVASGTLTGGGNTITATNVIAGQIYGNPRPRAIEMEGDGGAATLNGSGRTSALVIIGER